MKSSTKELLKGCGLVFLSHILFIVAIALIFGTLYLLQICVNYCILLFWVPVAFNWIAQLNYVIPLAVYFSRKQKPDFVKGILIGAGITFLLGAGTCGGAFILSMFNAASS